MTRSELPSRWRLTTIGEIAREKPNNGIFRKNSEYLTNGSEGLPVVWVEELFRGDSINTKDSRRVTATKSEITKYGLKHGDLLFCRSSLKLDGIAFNNLYLGEDHAALFECHLIRVSPNLEEVAPVFLNWLLRTPQVRAVAKSKSKTATMTTIDQQSLASIPIVLPPLTEQRWIAEVLDRAEALRAKRRAALVQLDSLTQLLFLDLFGDPATNPKGWPPKPIGSLASKFSDGPFGSNLKSEHYTETGVRVIRLQNIGVGVFMDDDTAYVSERHFAGLKKHECRPGDILVGTLGDPNLRACLQPEWLPIALNKADCVQIRPDERVANAIYICALLNQPATERMAQDLMHGQTRVRISMGRLRGLEVPVPPIELQREFARQVQAVEKLKTAQRASLKELDALFASLQHRAFRGEL